MAISTSDTPGSVPAGKTAKTTTKTETADQSARTPENSDRGALTPVAPGVESNAPLADSQSPIPRDSDGRIIPTPGDVRTEPVATARESHVAGRVGPATIAEDADALHGVGEIDQVAPGTVRADTAEGTGPVPAEQTEDPQGEFLADLDNANGSDDARDRDSR